jgi:hypothetical protein
MSWFSWLVVVRAAEQLHLQPEASFQSTTVDDIPIQLVGPVADCTITPPRDAVVTIRCGNVAIRVVGVPAVLDGETGGDIESLRRQLGDAATGASEDHVLLLHLPASRGQASSPAEPHPTANWRSACAWEPGTTHGTKLSILPISPWDIASVERVARYLRWHLHAPQLLAYPPKVRCSIPGTPAGMEWTVRGENRDEWRVLRRPKPRENWGPVVHCDAHYKATASAGGKAAQHARRDADERAQCRAQITQHSRASISCAYPVCWEGTAILNFLHRRHSASSALDAVRCGACFDAVAAVIHAEHRTSGQRQLVVTDGSMPSLAVTCYVPCHQSRGKVSLVCPSCKQCACSALASGRHPRRARMIEVSMSRHWGVDGTLRPKRKPRPVSRLGARRDVPHSSRLGSGPSVASSHSRA